MQLLLAWPASAEDARPLRGVALVIGESRYQSLPALPNPANDARAVAQLLGSLGFEVSSIPNGDGPRLARGLKHFVEDAAGADVAIGTRTHDRASLLAARDAFISARDIFREQHYSSGFEGFYRKELDLVEQQLAQAK
nr:caspase family protein [Mesorhizobium qingshengii]